MERYAIGDDAAFDALYRVLAPELTRFVGSLARDRATTDDLVQQTFLQIHEARGRFRRGAHVAPWAFVIARRLFLDVARRRRRAPFDPAVDGEVERPDAVTPEDVAAAAQLADVASATLARLPESQRRAFELVREDGLSVAEAAAAVGPTVGALKVRAFRAYEALRASLGGGA